MVDVDTMLDAFTPEEFSERLAAERIDGSAPEWVERLATIMKLGFATMSLSKVDPEMFDPLKPQDIETDSNPFGETEQEAASPDQSAAMFAMAFGKPDA